MAYQVRRGENMITRLRLSLLLLFFAAGGTFAQTAAPEHYFTLRFPPDQPVLYCQISENGLRIAKTPEGLKSAELIPPASQSTENPLPNIEIQKTEFAPHLLPLPTDKTLPAVQAAFTLSRYLPPGGDRMHYIIASDFTLTKTEANGDQWAYSYPRSAIMPAEADETVSWWPAIDLPRLAHLTLTLAVNWPPSGRSFDGNSEPINVLGVGVRLEEGKQYFTQVIKNGEPVPCKVEIIGEDHLPISTRWEPLEYFAFDAWSGRYGQQLLHSGPCRVEASFEAGPNLVLKAEKTVDVELPPAEEKEEGK
jgi:hypothetical protein